MQNRNAIKRKKELARQDKQRAKDASRLEKRKDVKTTRADGEDAVDPDIAGIVPGPQPPAPE